MEYKLLRSASKFGSPTKINPVSRAGDGHIRSAAEGAFEGYASLFHIRDLGNDIVMPGAFEASLADRGSAGVKMLWQHDATQPVGTWSSIVEDARGLKVRGQLNLQVGKAREIHALMREGAVDGLSIGFRTKRAERDAKSGIRRLYKLDLWEISLVTFPMLPQARVDAVKRGPLLIDGISGGDVQTQVIRNLRRLASLMR